MGQAIPRQHPAVVLRSQFNMVRALLAVAMIAVLALTATVVILAGEGDEAGGATIVRPAETTLDSVTGGGPRSTVPRATPVPQATVLPQRRLDGATDTPRPAPQSRYDGGPDEGTRGPGR